MASQPFILFLSDGPWRACTLRDGQPVIGEITFPDGASPAEKATAAATALQPLGYGGEGTILALPSAWCLAASISTDDLPAGDRKAMLYRLEEKLPVAAESLIADFVIGPEGSSTALGVAAESQPIKELVDALENAGVAVQSITPQALLAAQGMPSSENQTPHVLLCGDDSADSGQLSLISFETQQPTAWAVVANDPDDLKFQLNLSMVESSASPRVEACGVVEELIDAVTDQSGILITPRPETPLVAAARFAGAIATGRQTPWVELRRGALAIDDPLRLHRKPLNALLASVAVVLVAFAGVMLYRGSKYQGVAQSADAQTADAFSKQFPGWTMPSNVRAVVDSEHRKLSAWTGSALPAQATRSALQTLHDVLEKLPANGRFTIDHANFDDGTFVLDGRLRSYEQVDAMAAASRQAGMTVDPPQARKDAAGFWIFTLRGTRTVGNEKTKGG